MQLPLARLAAFFGEAPLSDAFADIAAMSFERALAELESIVSELESGKAELERSIQVYERGAALKAHCEAKLKEAQLRVEKIVMGPSGPTGVEPADFG